MEFKVNFNMDNDVFNENPEKECARILNELAKQVKAGRTYGRIIDLNGNPIGNWEIETP